MTINTRLERARLIKRPNKANAVALSAKAAEFQLLLINKFEALNSAPSDDIDTYCDNITSSITEAALNTAGKDKARRPDKLSLVTKQLRVKRRQMKRNGADVQHIEYTEICKAITSQMSEDISNYNVEQLIKSLENNKGIKTIKRKQCLGRSNIISLKEENGTHIHGQDRMINRCEEFFANLYSTKLPQGLPSVQIQRDTRNTPPPPILPIESAAIKRLKRNKAPGNDNITADILKDGGEPIVQMFTNMFNRCLSEGKLQNSWENASVILIHKKGDTADIKNYRPISLLPITYKVFSQVILHRMLHTLDQHQPREQAGFWSGFSTIDHIQVISQLQEKAGEYKTPLCFAFVDYEKAFDSIEFNPLFEALENQVVEAAYITPLRDLYNGATSTLKLHRESDKINLQRGVRQGDKLFTACLQDAIINKINWEGKGINIDGEHLSHLIFADDIVLIAKSPEELVSMLTDIHLASKPVGLSMNLSKTKVMLNETAITSTVTVDGNVIENVARYMYLGKTVT